MRCASRTCPALSTNTCTGAASSLMGCCISRRAGSATLLRVGGLVPARDLPLPDDQRERPDAGAQHDRRSGEMRQARQRVIAMEPAERRQDVFPVVAFDFRAGLAA